MSTSYTVESSDGVNYKLIVCDEIKKKREEEDKKRREKDERKKEENERKKKENEILIQRALRYCGNTIKLLKIYESGRYLNLLLEY